MPPRSKAPKRSTRRHVTPAPSEEVLDLNVSGSEDDDDGSAAQPAPTNAQPVTPVDIGINNPDMSKGKGKRKIAGDIRYFFDVTSTGKTCKECV